MLWVFSSGQIQAKMTDGNTGFAFPIALPNSTLTRNPVCDGWNPPGMVIFRLDSRVVRPTKRARKRSLLCRSAYYSDAVMLILSSLTQHFTYRHFGWRHIPTLPDHVTAEQVWRAGHFARAGEC